MPMLTKEKHLGHLLYEQLVATPDAICQLDASTGEEETNGSVLKRSVRLARSLRSLGLVPGDVLALSGRNHLDLQIPFAAGLFNGLPITGIDVTYKIDEIKSVFKVTEPKVAFCEPESYDDYVKATAELGMTTKIYSFGKGDHTMQELIETYSNDATVEEFQVASFDVNKVYVWLVSSGGTTGVVKVAAISHKALKLKFEAMLSGMFGSKERKERAQQPALHTSTIQWISGIFNLIGMPILQQTRIQTSAPVTPEHVIEIINKYKPTSAMMNPSLASSLLNADVPCDWSCFQMIILTGSKVFQDVLLGLREKASKTLVMEAYGQTENLGPILLPNPKGPLGNCGRQFPGTQIKLVDPETEQMITEPNVPGELWTKGIGFSCYYNNPEETASAFTVDGWFKTGDLLYYDEDGNYFFVERCKLLIKYRNNPIVPPELEEVIRGHKAVLDVSVTSVPHGSDGEHPVACVVLRSGATVTAQEIKDLVASKLSDSKRLRGGVVFLDKLPVTPAGKVARGKLRQLVQTMHRE